MKLADAEHKPARMKHHAHKLHGHMVFQGLRIAVENPKGGVRSGVNAKGKKWRTVMKVPYGYIVNTTGADDEGVDVFVGPDKNAPNAYVVHQKKDDGSYDEDKCLLGCANKEEAKKLYLAHYDTDKYLGAINEVPMERFKKLVLSGNALTKISRITLRAFVHELAEIGRVL